MAWGAQGVLGPLVAEDELGGAAAWGAIVTAGGIGGAVGGVVALAGITSLHAVGIDAVFLQPACEDRDIAVGDADPLRAGGGDGIQQAFPIGVVGEDEAAIDGPLTARAANPHPTGDETGRMRAEAIGPRRSTG